MKKLFTVLLFSYFFQNSFANPHWTFIGEDNTGAKQYINFNIKENNHKITIVWTKTIPTKLQIKEYAKNNKNFKSYKKIVYYISVYYIDCKEYKIGVGDIYYYDKYDKIIHSDYALDSEYYSSSYRRIIPGSNGDGWASIACGKF